MKKSLAFVLSFLLLVCTVFLLCACGESEREVKFMVDGAAYKTVVVTKDKALTLPANPTKDCCEFVGWYLDDGTWSNKFTATTADSLSSESTTVYAKFSEPGHTLTQRERIEATCLEEGRVKHFSCTVCSKIFSDEAATTEISTVAIAKLAHTLTLIEKTEATCTSEGVEAHWNCSSCHKNFSDEAATAELSTVIIAKLAHTLTQNAKKPATCIADGTAEHWTCSVCNNNYKEDSATTLLDTVLIPKSHTISTTGVCTVCNTNLSAGLTFTKVDSSYTVTGYTGKSFQVAIPSVYNNAPVTRIADNAFYNCISLTSVIIPESVTSIGDNAFFGCYKLVEVYNLSPSITVNTGSVANGNIGTYALSVLTSFASKSNLYQSGDYIFYEDGDTVSLVGYKGSSNTLTLPGKYNDKNYSVYQYAFYGSTATSVTVPDSVSVIGDYAFADSTALATLTINNGVTDIGNYAFFGCTALTGASIPASITAIGSYAFSGCEKLTEIAFGTSTSAIGAFAFYGCEELTKVTLPSSITMIGNSAFKECVKLEKVYIGDITKWCAVNFEGICSNPLTYATKLYFIGGTNPITEISIPSGVTSIPAYAFSSTAITRVTIPATVTNIGNYAFYGATSLTNATLGNGVTKIGNYAFFGCTSLSSVSLSNKLTGIGMYAFGNCTALQLNNLVIPNSVTTIGEYAFAGSGIKNVSLSAGVDSIGFGAFYNCALLTGILVENNNAVYKTVNGSLYSKDGKTLIQYAIGKNETAFTVPDTVVTIGSLAFAGSTKLQSVVIPNSVKTIDVKAFGDCTALSSIIIGSGVTTIGKYTFENCSALTSIKYRSTQANWNKISKGTNWKLNAGSCTLSYSYSGT